MPERDYKSFPSVAKSRFRPMARELGYDQITGTLYTKARDGWYETFNLQFSSYGNPFFYFNYGVKLTRKFPADVESLKSGGWLMGKRLRYNDQGAFPAAIRAEIELSAAFALEEYKRVAVPWLNALTIEEIRGS